GRNPDFVGGIERLTQMPFATRKELAARQKATEEFLKKWKLPIVLPIASEITFDKVFVRLPVKGSLSWRSSQRIDDLNEGQEWIAILLKNPHFLFLIDAKNAFDSNTKVARDKFSSTLILTRENKLLLALKRG